MSGYTERKQFMLHKAEKKTWDPDAKAIKSHPKTFEPPIPVLLPSNLTESQLLDFVPFGNWLVNYTNNLDRQKTSDHTFHEHPYKLREIEVQAADWFKQENKPDRLGFIKLQHSCHTEPYINEEGKQAKDWLTGCAFLRGASVAILLVLQEYDPSRSDHEIPKMTILTHQPRPAATSLDFVEIPAGMLDKGELISKARGELEEEVGLVVKDEDLFDMTAKALEGESTDGAPKEAIQNAMYPSPGGCDEAVSLMLCQKRLTREKMEELNGKATGLRHEGEMITLELIPLERLYRRGARDAKALGALCLYLELGREGLLPAMPMMPDAS